MERYSGLVKIGRGLIVTLPSPINISSWWNFGSLLGVCLVLQIFSGLVLSLHFTAQAELSFFTVIQSFGDVYYNWWFRAVHANGASFFLLGSICMLVGGYFTGRMCISKFEG